MPEVEALVSRRKISQRGPSEKRIRGFTKERATSTRGLSACVASMRETKAGGLLAAFFSAEGEQKMASKKSGRGREKKRKGAHLRHFKSLPLSSPCQGARILH